MNRGFRFAATIAWGVVTAHAPAHAQSLIGIAVAENGDELFVDRASLRTLPPIGEMRGFVATQLWVTNIVQATRRVPARTERYHFSFNCMQRTSMILVYRNNRAGTKLQDWQAADLDYKYEAPRTGSLADFAMQYACSGGRLPIAPKAAAEAAGEEEDEDSQAP